MTEDIYKPLVEHHRRKISKVYSDEQLMDILKEHLNYYFKRFSACQLHMEPVYIRLMQEVEEKLKMLKSIA